MPAVSPGQETLQPFYAEPGYENVIEELGDLASHTVIKSRGDTIVAQAEFNGELLVSRTPHKRPGYREGYGYERLHKRIRALQLGIGLPGLEHMVSYSVPEQMVVTRHAGTPLDAISTYAVRQIAEKEWGDALINLGLATERGLCLDTGTADNVTYSKESGLTFIDYCRQVDEDLTRNASAPIEFCEFLETTLRENRARESSAKAIAWRRTGRKALRVMLERYPDSNDQYPVATRIRYLQKNYLGKI